MMASEPPGSRVAFYYKLMHQRSTCRWGSLEPRNACRRAGARSLTSADASEGKHADGATGEMEWKPEAVSAGEVGDAMLKMGDGLQIAGGLVVNRWLARLFWDMVARGNARVNTNAHHENVCFTCICAAPLASL